VVPGTEGGGDPVVTPGVPVVGSVVVTPAQCATCAVVFGSIETAFRNSCATKPSISQPLR